MFRLAFSFTQIWARKDIFFFFFLIKSRLFFFLFRLRYIRRSQNEEQRWLRENNLILAFKIKCANSNSPFFRCSFRRIELSSPRRSRASEGESTSPCIQDGRSKARGGSDEGGKCAGRLAGNKMKDKVLQHTKSLQLVSFFPLWFERTLMAFWNTNSEARILWVGH